MQTLREASCGQKVKVMKITGEGPVKRRIMDMGITKGVEIPHLYKPYGHIFLSI